MTKPLNAEFTDDCLNFWRPQELRESTRRSMVGVGIFFGTDNDHGVRIMEQRIAFEEEGQVERFPLSQKGASVGKGVGAHLASTAVLETPSDSQTIDQQSAVENGITSRSDWLAKNPAWIRSMVIAGR